MYLFLNVPATTVIYTYTHTRTLPGALPITTPGTAGAVDCADTAIGSATNASAELARNQIDVRTTVSPSLFVGRFGLSISHDSIGRRQKCKINSIVLAI